MPDATQSISSRPVIGIFDSGIGGVTVLRAMLEKLPFANFVYFGDTARVPYGNKSQETIVRYALENVQFLLTKKIDFLVVACNTASAYALDVLREHHDLPIYGVIEPGARRAIEVTQSGRIAVLGTKGTIYSGAYERAIKRFDPEIKVISIPCPLLAPLVEEGFLNHPATRLILKEYLSRLHNEGVDTVVLGCTHYPMLRDSIAEEVGEGITIVDSASTCAEEVSLEPAMRSCSGLGYVAFYVSDDPHKFKSMGESFLQRKILHVDLVGDSALAHISG